MNKKNTTQKQNKKYKGISVHRVVIYVELSAAVRINKKNRNYDKWLRKTHDHVVGLDNGFGERRG